MTLALLPNKSEKRKRMAEHIPVLLNECLDGLNIKSDGTYLDLTLGRAGHSKEILKRLNKGLLIGFDQDIEAIEASKKTLEEISNNFLLIHKNFSSIDEVLKENNIQYVDGILMDLGVSSPQFDKGERGFSYRFDATLDMRMDQRNNLTAYNIINEYSVKELAIIFSQYGEEKYALSIAKNIDKQRKISPIKTTFELVDIVKRSKPIKELNKLGHPAKQVFQALRIAVNDELNVLTLTLDKAIKSLNPNGGRLAVITFHSLEDRIVKQTFKKYAIIEGNRLDGPNVTELPSYRLINNKPIVANLEELESNHRSASAKLRIIERIKE